MSSRGVLSVAVFVTTADWFLFRQWFSKDVCIHCKLVLSINFKSDFDFLDRQFLSGSFESLYAYFYFRSTFSFTQGWWKYGNHQVWSLFILKLVLSPICQVFIESANFPSECVTDESDSSVIFSLLNRVRAFLNALSSLINACPFCSLHRF